MQRKGFTLIELLIVIGILGFLAAAILVAVDPVKRVQDARNAKRWSEVNGLLNAVLTKQVDDKAMYDGTPATIAPVISHDTNSQVIVRVEPGVGACAAVGTQPLCPGQTLSAVAEDCVANISSIAPTYLAEIANDPTGTVPATGPAIGNNNTGYYIHRNTSNRIEIGSCWPDQGATVKVKR